MGTILFGRLCHQPHIGNTADGGRIKGPILLAVFYYRLIYGGIGAIGNQRDRVVQLVIGAPGASAIADNHGHGGVNNRIARHMQIGDSPIGVHHRQLWADAVDRLDIRLDFRSFVLRQRLNLRVEFSDSVVRIHREFAQVRRVFLQHVLVVNRHAMPENNRVGHTHHGRLHMQ